MRVAVVTESLRHFVDQKESIKILKEIGFDAADITLFNVYDTSKLCPDIFSGDYIAKAKEIRKYADRINMPIIQAHATFPIHIEGNDEYNKEMFEKLKKCIEVCGILGVNNVVIHPYHDWTPEQNAEYFHRLIPLAKKNHVVICTENMWHWDHKNNYALPAACYSPDNFLKHIEAANDEYLQACVDVGHANMFSHIDKSITPGNMVRTLGEYVKCFHIHDNDGVFDLHETPFTLKLDWEDLIKAIKEIHYQGDMVLETLYVKDYTLEQMIERNKLELEMGRKLVALIEK